MLHIAVTGGIATGKSVVCKILEIFGGDVYYSDKKANILMHENLTIKNKLISRFGDTVYENDSLNKVFLAEKIFNNPLDRQYVDSVVHPVVVLDYMAWREKSDKKFTVMESALLPILDIKMFYKVIFVSSPYEMRVSRLICRDESNSSFAIAKINAQPSFEEYLTISDFIINNDEKEFLSPQVLNIIKSFDF